jgi:hypothetical protein
MNESPPVPVSNSFNKSQWNATDTGKSATQSWVNRNFLSKVLADTAANLISFANAIKTNVITAYSENILTIGEGGGGTKTVRLYYPYLAVAILDAADDTGRIPSTSWVQLWFGNIINNLSLTWANAQTFTLGIVTNSIKCITTSGILNINSVEMGTGGVIICGGSTQTSGVTIGNTNGITTNKIDIGSQTKTLSLTGSTIDLITPFRPFYSYTAAGTGAGKIGEIVVGSYTGGATIGSGGALVYSSILLDVGIWHIDGMASFDINNVSTIVDFVDIFIQTNPATAYGTTHGRNITIQPPQSLSQTYCYPVSSIINKNVGGGLTTVNLVVQITYTGTIITTNNGSNNFKFIATRIA